MRGRPVEPQTPLRAELGDELLAGHADAGAAGAGGRAEALDGGVIEPRLQVIVATWHGGDVRVRLRPTGRLAVTQGGVRPTQPSRASGGLPAAVADEAVVAAGLAEHGRLDVQRVERHDLPPRLLAHEARTLGVERDGA